MSPGHTGGGRSYPNCNWEHVWKVSLFDRLLAAIRTVIATFAGNPPPGVQNAELVLDIDAAETNLYLDGALADLLGRDSSFVVTYEGQDVTMVHRLVNRLLGSHRVGEWRSMPTATADTFTSNRASYPAIQRGEWSGGELWWDPYYISADDPGDPGCEAGLIYAPRDSDPLTLIPDLQDYMHSLLPAVEPDLRPLDQNGGWAYVQVPLNFAVEPGSIAPVTASASVVDPLTGGSVWANATATPVSLVFEPGDGSPTVKCDIADATLPFDPEEPGNCAHTYLNSSNPQPGDVYPTALFIEWQGEFVSSSGGPLVTFPIAPTVATFDLAVGEARAATSIDP